MKLIDKDALVAEIERMKDEYLKHCKNIAHAECSCGTLDSVLYYINTLEVKEADLEKEIQNHVKECLDVKFPTTDIELIKKDVTYTAKKFFKLGLAQKGE